MTDQGSALGSIFSVLRPNDGCQLEQTDQMIELQCM